MAAILLDPFDVSSSPMEKVHLGYLKLPIVILMFQGFAFFDNGAKCSFAGRRLYNHLIKLVYAEKEIIIFNRW